MQLMNVAIVNLLHNSPNYSIKLVVMLKLGFAQLAEGGEGGEGWKGREGRGDGRRGGRIGGEREGNLEGMS